MPAREMKTGILKKQIPFPVFCENKRKTALLPIEFCSIP